MKRYIVKLVFNIAHQFKNPSTEFDEQFRFVEAQNDEEAFLKARFIGVKNEHSFENQEGETVTWNFIDVAFIKELPDLKDGMELFSMSHDAEDPAAYVKFVHHQAESKYSKSGPHSVSID